MVGFNYELDYKISNEESYRDWILSCVLSYDFTVGDINYIFCDDIYLLKMNNEFLSHDTLTDIISFDYTIGGCLGGDVFISLDRVKENALEYDFSFEEELKRVMIHGVLHYVGFKDKTAEDKALMRKEEDKCLLLFK